MLFNGSPVLEFLKAEELSRDNGIEMAHHTDGRDFSSLLQMNARVQWDNRAYSYYRKGISIRTDRYRFVQE